MSLNTPYICSQCLRAAQHMKLSKPLSTFSKRPASSSTAVHRIRTLTQSSRSTSKLPILPHNRYQQASYSAIAQAPSPQPHPPPPLSPETIPILNPQFAEDGKALLISITPRAAHRLSKIMAKDANPSLVLRISVESGGCHGFQYLMSLQSTREISVEEDTLFVYEAKGQARSEPAQDSVAGQLELLAQGKAKVVMDSTSLELLEGSKVDYTMELIGSQFKIVDNPRATSSCGCGTSFDVNFS